MIVSRMRDTLAQARVGVQDLRDALATARRRLEVERQELATTQRRRGLAQSIGDAETVRVAEQYERLHAERVEVLSRKVAAQEEELAIAEREVAQMMTELKAAASGAIPPGGRGENAAALEDLEAELDGGAAAAREEIDALSRQRSRSEREADAARRLEELKRRMGK